MTDRIDAFIEDQERLTGTADAVEKLLREVLVEASYDVDLALTRMGGENASLREIFERMKAGLPA